MARQNNVEKSRPREVFARYAVDTLYDAIGAEPSDSRRELRKKHAAAFDRVASQGMQAEDTVEHIDYNSQEEAVNFARRVFVESPKEIRAEYDAHIDWAKRRGTTWMNPVTALLDRGNEEGPQMYLHVITNKRMDSNQPGLENLRFQLSVKSSEGDIRPWPNSETYVEMPNPDFEVLRPENIGTVLSAFDSSEGLNLESQYHDLKLQMADKGLDKNLPPKLKDVLAMSHFGETLAPELGQNQTGQIDLYYPLHNVGIDYFPPEERERSRVPLAVAGTLLVAGVMGAGIYFQENITNFWANRSENNSESRVAAPEEQPVRSVRTPYEVEDETLPRLEAQNVVEEVQTADVVSSHDVVETKTEELESCNNSDNDLVNPYEQGVNPFEAEPQPDPIQEFYENGIFPSKEGGIVGANGLKRAAAKRDLIFDLEIEPEMPYTECPEFMEGKDLTRTSCHVLEEENFKENVKDRRGKLVPDGRGGFVKKISYKIRSGNPDKDIVRVAVYADYFSDEFDPENPKASLERQEGYVLDEDILRSGLRDGERVVLEGDLVNMLGAPGTVSESTIEVDLRGADGREETEDFVFMIKK